MLPTIQVPVLTPVPTLISGRSLLLYSRLSSFISSSIFSLEKGRTVEYYTGFLFDYNYPTQSNSINIAGGGRYDDLMKSVSSDLDIPAFGAALNLERIENVIAREKLS